MAWTAPTDRLTGDVITAAQWNTFLGLTGDLSMTAAAIVTTNGDMVYATGANTLVRRAIGTAGQTLQVSGGVPAWVTVASTAIARQELLDMDVPYLLQSSAATFSANRAFLMPIKPIFASVTVTQLIMRITVQSGNFDVGIYSYDGTTFTRVVSLGSTACPAAASRNAINIADTVLPSGARYFFAFVADNGTLAAAYMQNQAIVGGQPISFSGYNWFKDSSFPLPATITGVSSTTQFPQMAATLDGGVQL